MKVLAGDLSASFNLNRDHGKQFLDRKDSILRSLCNLLLLHDRVIIPTYDYADAAGLIRILGEGHFRALLDDDRVGFARLRGIFSYVRGTGQDGSLLVFEDPARKRPEHAPIEQSLESALRTVKSTEKKGLSEAVFKHSAEFQTGRVIDAIRQDAYRDLRQSAMWKASYDWSHPDLLALPGIETMSGRLLTPSSDISNNVIDALLALGLMNSELYIADQLGCEAITTGTPQGDCFALKMPRLGESTRLQSSLWSFLDIAGTSL